MKFLEVGDGRWVCSRFWIWNFLGRIGISISCVLNWVCEEFVNLD